jgi:Family of unknown function (DUF6428)
MNIQDFLEQLQPQTGKPLTFEYESERLVPAGYHVTEIINASFESMDCGGQANTWRQTIIQLMGPNRLDTAKFLTDEFMSVEKFLKIYNQVSSSLPVRPESEVRIEYGNSQQPAIHYHVESLEIGESVRVRLSPPGVTCKASDRKIEAATCCSPVASMVSNVVWADSNPISKPSKGCC